MATEITGITLAILATLIFVAVIVCVLGVQYAYQRACRLGRAKRACAGVLLPLEALGSLTYVPGFIFYMDSRAHWHLLWTGVLAAISIFITVSTTVWTIIEVNSPHSKYKSGDVRLRFFCAGSSAPAQPDGQQRSNPPTKDAYSPAELWSPHTPEDAESQIHLPCAEAGTHETRHVSSAEASK